MENNNLKNMENYNCKDLIDKFLLSSKETLTVRFTHLGKINLNEAIGIYNNIKCEFNNNDLNYLNNNGERYEIKTYYDTIYYDTLSKCQVPSKSICTSK